MQARARKAKTLAQIRLGEVLTMYVNYLMRVQARCAGSEVESLQGGVIPEPNASFPSFNYFCAENEPDITVAKYSDRLATYMGCSGEAFMFALAYLRRLMFAGFPLNSRSIHRILLTATLVAAKTRDDYFYSMSYYAQIGGVSTWDLRSMELRFLAELIDFRTDILPEEYLVLLHSISAAVELERSSSAAAPHAADAEGQAAPSDHINQCYSEEGLPPQWVVECDIYF